MALCPHCGETMAKGQETCYACGQHVRTRAYRHERRVNPIVIVLAALAAVAVLVSLWLNRAGAARKQAAIQAEEAALRAEDSTRSAARQWQDAVRAAEKDDEARALAAEFDGLESRFESVRTRVAASPSPLQERIVDRVEAQLEQLRHSAVVLASTPDAEKQVMRDSIQAGMRRVEELTQELGGTE